MEKGIFKFIIRNYVIVSLVTSLLVSSLSDTKVFATKKTTYQVFESLKTCEKPACCEDVSTRCSSERYAVPPPTKRVMFWGISNEYTTKNRRQINADKVIKIDSKTLPGKKFSLIATQSPIYMSESIYGRYFASEFYTLSSFWDLAFTSEHVDTVISLGMGEVYKTKPRLLDYLSSDSVTSDMNCLYKVKRESLEYIHSVLKANMTITDKTKEKTIECYNFYDWPDRQLPINKNDFEAFVKQFEKKRKLVVHCSSGVGRIGVFCACIYALKSGCSDPVKIVKDLSKYNISTIYMPKQFDFICKFIARNCIDLESKGLSKPTWGEEIDYDAYFQ